jgi:hypothetical protein
MTGQLTDELIDAAVRQLPAEMYAVDGVEITAKLRKRRDNLAQAADAWYTYLAESVEIHATDTNDRIVVSQLDDDAVLVAISTNASDAQPYASRRFHARETKEILLRLHAGDDVVTVNAREKLPLTVRVLGGEGADELHYETSTLGVKFYDQAGDNRVTGMGAGRDQINTKPYREWFFTPEDRFMPLHWWRRTIPVAVLGMNADYGFLLGYGRTWLDYGFRKDPYARRVTLTGAVSSQLKWDARLDSDFRFENSPWHTTFMGHATQLDVLHFFDFGNDSPRGDDEDFYAVDQTVITLAPAISRQFNQKKTAPESPLSFSRQTALSFGLALRHSSTRSSETNIIGTMPNLYGGQDFWQAGAYARLIHDDRDMAAAPTKGTTLRLSGGLVPELLDVRQTYGWLDAVGSIYFSIPGPFEPVLAFRAGGKKIWGDFPYFESAFLGGVETLRGWDRERFAGDTSLYGGSELRLLLAETRSLLISHFGIFGFADGGRVYVDGDSPGELHYGYGGGIWTSFLGRPNTVSLALANSDESLQVYLVWGFAF